MLVSAFAEKIQAVVKEHGDFDVDIDVRVDTQGLVDTMWFYVIG